MMYVITLLYIVLIVLLLRITVAKTIFRIEYEVALKRGNRKRAIFFGSLYYRCVSANERGRNIAETIANDLESYQVSHS